MVSGSEAKTADPNTTDANTADETAPKSHKAERSRYVLVVNFMSLCSICIFKTIQNFWF
jgi:hypothetical protein